MLSNWCDLRCSICIADLVNDVIALKDLVMMISVFHFIFSIGTMGVDWSSLDVLVHVYTHPIFLAYSMYIPCLLY